GRLAVAGHAVAVPGPLLADLARLDVAGDPPMLGDRVPVVELGSDEPSILLDRERAGGARKPAEQRPELGLPGRRLAPGRAGGRGWGVGGRPMPPAASSRAGRASGGPPGVDWPRRSARRPGQAPGWRRGDAALGPAARPPGPAARRPGRPARRRRARPALHGC